jgi:hypothetical protein
MKSCSLTLSLQHSRHYSRLPFSRLFHPHFYNVARIVPRSGLPNQSRTRPLRSHMGAADGYAARGEGSDVNLLRPKCDSGGVHLNRRILTEESRQRNAAGTHLMNCRFALHSVHGNMLESWHISVPHLLHVHGASTSKSVHASLRRLERA